MRLRIFVSILLFGLIAACEPIDRVIDQYRDLTAYERYAFSLEKADLDQTALGKAWMAAGQRALSHRILVEAPFREIGYFDPAHPAAHSFAFALRRGHRLVVRIEPELGDSTMLFTDLYELAPDSTRPPLYRASADSLGDLTYRVGRNRTYLLRIQPELLVGGRYTVTIEAGPSLGFPVAGSSSASIRSFFGDPRDGGRRDHHGVDIFAPRGRPAIAAADGTITRVQNTDLGGKVIWLRTREDQHNLYYAHLDSQLVSPRDRVQRGDTLGLIGNTGNARWTPPHLHFGIYQRGPVDPWPFIHAPVRRPPEIRLDPSSVGTWGRITRTSEPLRTHPDSRAPVVAELARHQVLLRSGASQTWYRATLPDGVSGYVRAAAVEDALTSLGDFVTEAGLALRYAPDDRAVTVDSLPTGSSVAILGHAGGYALVRTGIGKTAWSELRLSFQ